MNNILSSVTNITNNSTPPQHSLTLAERGDIHKSCKSLETLLNVLNDYCEAATAIVTLQRRLAKALRDTSGSKVTSETASKALSASANIFETLVEVDSKFVKIADKEYDMISTEVKRWFKKLAKEEKAHDERIASANAKIKQAGLNFEKKSKKKPTDAQDEHSKYIHLISTLGPEVTQDKYHSLQVMQRHTATIYSVAASFSRIADTEWARSCENVRRFAPTVGILGEWKSLCEGGWTKEIPGDLPNLDDKHEDKLILNTIQERVEPEEEVQDERANRSQQQGPGIQGRQIYDTSSSGYERSDGDFSARSTQHLSPSRNERDSTSPTSPSYHPHAHSSHSGNSPILPRHTPTSINVASLPASNVASLPPASVSASPPQQTPASQTHETSPEPQVQSQPIGRDRNTPATVNDLRPPSPTSHHSHTQTRDPSPASDRGGLFSDPATGSVRSLSAFPPPPTHFPLPPPRARDSPALANSRPPDSLLTTKEGSEEQTRVAKERLSESPLPLEYSDERLGVHDNTLSVPQPTSQRQSGGGGGKRERRVERQHSNLGPDNPRHSPVSILPNTSDIFGPSSTTPLYPSDSYPQNLDRVPHTITEREREEFQARDFGVSRRESGNGVTGRIRTLSGGALALLDSPVEFPSTSVSPQRRDGLLERTDTGSSASGSIVAAMKNRYSSAPGTRSPPPRTGDLPRIHKSVTEMASRYQSQSPQGLLPSAVTHTSNGGITEIGELREHQSPRIKQAPLRSLTKSPSPMMSRNISLPTTPEKITPRQYGGSSSSLTPTISTRPLPTPNTPSLSGMRESLDGSDDQTHWRLAGARERELRDRERELMLREKELERDRARLLALRDGPALSSPSANESEHGSQCTGETRDSIGRDQAGQLQPRPRERGISLHRLRQDSQPKSPQMRQELLLPHSKSSSQVNLALSVSSPNLRERRPSQQSYSSPPSSNMPSSTHEPSGSSTMTSSSGNTSYSSRPVISPPPPPQEKKGGWMRRLSVPVGNALPFSLDSSKRHANNSASSTTSNTPANISSPKAGVRNLGAGIVGGKGVALDERRHSSSASLSLGAADTRDRVRDYAYEQQQLQQPEEQDRGRFSGLGLGLGRKSHEASRSAMNLNYGRIK